MLQKYKCGNCDHIFNEHELICEDWRDPKKSIVCPKCRYYLEVPKNPRIKYVVIAAIIAVVLSIFLAFIKPGSRALMGTFIFIVLPVWFWATGDPTKPMKTVHNGKSNI